MYSKLIEHIAGKKSNVVLQKPIIKHSLHTFNFCVSEYFSDVFLQENKKRRK